MRKLFNTSWYDFIIGLGPILGGAAGLWIAQSAETLFQIFSAAAVGTLGLFLSILIARALRPRYKIESRKFRSVFETKLQQDIARFTDSNTAMQEAASRMSWDLKRALRGAELDRVLQKEVGRMEDALAWFGLNEIQNLSFSDIVQQGTKDKILSELVRKVARYFPGQAIRINTSIAEPGCVALIEFLKSSGLSIDHEFHDINGVVQAQTLSSSREFHASLIPLSTVILNENREDILKRYKFAFPVTSEDQQIVSSRDPAGKFSFDDITIVERGSGHFQWLAMQAAGSVSADAGKVVKLSDLGEQRRANVLYEPVASINLQATKSANGCGFITDLPFAVDIVLLSSKSLSEPARAAIGQLIVYAMWFLKQKLISNGQLDRQLYRRKDVRKAFEDANEPFSDFLVR